MSVSRSFAGFYFRMILDYNSQDDKEIRRPIISRDNQFQPFPLINSFRNCHVFVFLKRSLKSCIFGKIIYGVNAARCLLRLSIFASLLADLKSCVI